MVLLKEPRGLSSHVNQLANTLLAKHSVPTLLDMCDEILILIFTKLNSTDLINVSKSCAYFSDLCKENKLWTKVDLRNSSLDGGMLDLYAKRYLLPDTESIAVNLTEVKWTARKTKKFVHRIRKKCKDVKRLSLEGITIKHCFTHLSPLLPNLISVLSLKGSSVEHPEISPAAFVDIHVHLPLLEVLILSQCKWRKRYLCLAADLAGCSKLHTLFVDNCTNLSFSPLEMLRLGFKSLRVLDLRTTRVHSFYQISYMVENMPNIRQLFLSSYEDEGSFCRSHFFSFERYNVETLAMNNFTWIDDAVLLNMAQAAKLKALDVMGTRVTERGVQRFKTLRPDVAINYLDTF